RQAFTSSVDVTLPAWMRDEACASVSPATASDARDEEPIVAGRFSCWARAGDVKRVAAAAAPRTDAVNSRRDSCVIGRYDTPRCGGRAIEVGRGDDAVPLRHVSCGACASVCPNPST